MVRLNWGLLDFLMQYISEKIAISRVKNKICVKNAKFSNWGCGYDC